MKTGLINKSELLECLNDWIDENTTIEDVLRWISEFEEMSRICYDCKECDNKCFSEKIETILTNREV